MYLLLHFKVVQANDLNKIWLNRLIHSRVKLNDFIICVEDQKCIFAIHHEFKEFSFSMYVYVESNALKCCNLYAMKLEWINQKPLFECHPYPFNC